MAVLPQQWHSGVIVPGTKMVALPWHWLSGVSMPGSKMAALPQQWHSGVSMPGSKMVAPPRGDSRKRRPLPVPTMAAERAGPGVAAVAAMAARGAEAEALFEAHTAAELRAVERRLRAGIEQKREELRQMVGERYRDLIEAADTIAEMRRSAERLLGAVRGLQRGGAARPGPTGTVRGSGGGHRVLHALLPPSTLFPPLHLPPWLLLAPFPTFFFSSPSLLLSIHPVFSPLFHPSFYSFSSDPRVPSPGSPSSSPEFLRGCGAAEAAAGGSRAGLGGGGGGPVPARRPPAPARGSPAPAAAAGHPPSPLQPHPRPLPNPAATSGGRQPPQVCRERGMGRAG